MATRTRTTRIVELAPEHEALFVDRRQVRTGPPPSEEKLAALIRRRVRRLPAATPSSRTPP